MDEYIQLRYSCHKSRDAIQRTFKYNKSMRKFKILSNITVDGYNTFEGVSCFHKHESQ